MPLMGSCFLAGSGIRRGGTRDGAAVRLWETRTLEEAGEGGGGHGVVRG